MATDFTISPIPANEPHTPTLNARLKAVYADSLAVSIDRGADAVMVDGQGHDFSQQEEDDLRAVFAGHGTAGMASDKATITADDSDTAAITMSHAAIQNGETIEYAVYLGRALEIAGTETATAGQCDMTFKTGVAGVYTIMMQRQNENESGTITVEATNG